MIYNHSNIIHNIINIIFWELANTIIFYYFKQITQKKYVSNFSNSILFLDYVYYILIFSFNIIDSKFFFNIFYLNSLSFLIWLNVLKFLIKIAITTRTKLCVINLISNHALFTNDATCINNERLSFK